MQDLNEILKSKKLYFEFNFRRCPKKKVRIKRVEFVESKKDGRWRFEFYYDSWDNEASAGLLHYEEKESGINLLYRLFRDKKGVVASIY